MTFSESVKTVLRTKYATFSGRAARSEYWWFALFNALVMIVLGFFVGFSIAVSGAQVDPFTNQFSGFGVLPIIALILIGVYVLAIIIPTIAVTIRRFHDRNMSGWWYLGFIVLGMIPVVGFLASIASLVIMALKGTEGPNNFGPDPLQGGDADIFK